MLIRSQDKAFLLNFNNLTAIYMEKIGKDFAIVTILKTHIHLENILQKKKP